MEHVDILNISASLFLLSYFFNTFIYSSSNKIIKAKSFDIIPFIAITALSNISLFVSDFYVFKISVLFMLLAQALFLILKANFESNILNVFAIILSLLIVVMISLNIVFPILWLNMGLIMLSAVLIVLNFREYSYHKTKMHKEISEIHMISLIGIIVLSTGKSYFLINFGLIIYIVFQISELALFVKFYNQSRESIDKRLSELEYKFERSVDFEAKKRTSHMADKVEHIREKSQRDPMTKALNRFGITQTITELINDSTVKIFSIVMFDIDKFKTINDTKGHMVGDDCLKYLSYSFMHNNRKTDILGRYGGDEFILIMPHVNAPAAIEIADRMRLEIFNRSTPKFSISMGVSTYPYDGKSFSSLLEVADQGLYAAKENGRNQVKYKGNVFIKS